MSRHKALLLSVVLLASCSTADSTDIRTHGITAHITVGTGDHGGVSFSVNLSSGTLTDVDLAAGDHLVGETPDTRVTLEKTKFLGTATYRGQINDTDAKPGEQMTVRLVRGQDDVSAPHSVVRMPANVVVTSPKAGAEASRSAPLAIELSPAPGSIRVTWSGSCLQEDSAGLTFDEDTPVVIPAGSLVLQGQESACSVTFLVSRLRNGSLDPAYKGGSIRSERTVPLEVTSVD